MRLIPAVLLFIVMSLTNSPGVSAADAGATWKSLNEQAQQLQRQGDIEKAIDVAERSLAHAKSQFGADSAEAAESLSNLAALYRAQSLRLSEEAAQLRRHRGSGAMPAAPAAAARREPSGANSTPAADKLIFGVIAPRGVETTIKNWRPFTEAMSDSLRVPVELVATNNYKELVDSFKQGKIDVAWLSNITALEVVEAGKGAVFAQMITSKGSTGYKSTLIVHKDSKIKSIEDMLRSDKSLVFGDGDLKSTSGHVVPLYYAFVQNKVNDPAELFKEIKRGNHKTNAMRTAQREVDVATNNNEELQFFKDEQPAMHAQLRVIWTSPEIPQSPLVWRRALPAPLKRQISQFVTTYGKTEAEKQVLLQVNELGGFRRSSNRQLITISELEMFSEWRKLWNDRELSPAVRQQRERELSRRASRLEVYLRATEVY